MRESQPFVTLMHQLRKQYRRELHLKYDYVKINNHANGITQNLCIGVWVNDDYYPCCRDELEWHLISRCWKEDADKYPYYQTVNRLI